MNREEIYDQAERLKEEGKLDEAAANLEELVQNEPDYALAHSALAVVLQKLNRHDDALKHAVRVCELEPRDPFSFMALSVTYQRAFAGTGNHHYIHMAEDAMARARMLQGGM
jgi:predicted Zn-dependent protease